jgi:glycerate 2-kinase
MTDAEARALLNNLFREAVARAHPGAAVIRNLPEKPTGRCLVIGAGKASAAMALALEQAWPDVPIIGTVATRYGHSAPCQQVNVIEAGHPVPDENSMVGAFAMQALLQQARSDDLVIALLSGGGSACLALPIDGVTLAEKQEITRRLLHCGAPIGMINTVRRSISAVKGGALVAMAGGVPVLSLVISDVPGDDPAVVASGPTVPSLDASAEALEIIDRFGIAVSDKIRSLLATGRPPAPLRPFDTVKVIASPAMALNAVAQAAERFGCEAIVLGDAIAGEAATVGREIAATAAGHASGPRSRPLVLISGGETTVSMPPGCNRKGGRNTEFQLAFALAMQGRQRIWSLAADSDGIDGVSEAAGAIVAPDSLARAALAGIDPQRLLDEHRSYEAFADLGDLVITGPTLTNVNDIRIQLIA